MQYVSTGQRLRRPVGLLTVDSYEFVAYPKLACAVGGPACRDESEEKRSARRARRYERERRERRERGERVEEREQREKREKKGKRETRDRDKRQRQRQETPTPTSRHINTHVTSVPDITERMLRARAQERGMLRRCSIKVKNRHCCCTLR
eukprot:1098042-Rhodomonas_salina.2